MMDSLRVVEAMTSRVVSSARLKFSIGPFDIWGAGGLVVVVAKERISHPSSIAHLAGKSSSIYVT